MDRRLISIAIAQALVSGAGAATFVVDNDGTGQGCTLADAINAANTNLAVGSCEPQGDGDDLILIDVGASGGTVTVTADLSPLFEPVILRSADGQVATIDLNGFSPLETQGNGGVVVIEDLTLQNGRGLDGGAILNFGDLLITSVTITANLATRGAGIQTVGGFLTIDSSTIAGNSPIPLTEGFGGGVFCRSGGAVTIMNSTISGNTATRGGGIAGIEDCVFDFLRTTLTENSAYAAGGAAYMNGINAVLNYSQVDDNAAFGNGAGINALASDLTISDTTISGNSVSADVGAGGGMYVRDGNVRVASSTISRNGAGTQFGSGGGIFVRDTELITTSTVFSINTAFLAGGGAIAAFGGDATLTDSTISGNEASYGGGASFIDSPLTLDGVTISQNTADLDGGGLLSIGDSINAVAVTLAQNVSGQDGGGAFLRGRAEVRDSTITGNRADRDGGGLTIEDEIQITRSLIADNFAGRNGGGIDDRLSGARILSSDISDNTAVAGGGISSGDSYAGPRANPAYIYYCDFSGNTALEDGGGIFNDDGLIRIAGTTIAGNSASNGGGIWNSSAPLTIQNVTLDGNAASAGAAIGFFERQAPPVRMDLLNVTITDNLVPAFPRRGQVGGAVQTTGAASFTNTVIAGTEGGTDCAVAMLNGDIANFFGDASCDGVMDGDPQLALLGDFGGPTRTREPLEGSPLIDAGDGQSCPDVDQRGIPRDANCDIGAVERFEDEVFRSSFEVDEGPP
ncbi:MAG: choice-of-anchor Q domain-containing protein [Pseudomonadota bacterium]